MRTLLKETGVKDYKKAKPTKDHTVVIWEGMLGTVYSKNEKGEVKYFDYDWHEAVKFAGLQDAEDIRIAKYKRRDPYNENSPRKNQTCIWVK